MLTINMIYDVNKTTPTYSLVSAPGACHKEINFYSNKNENWF